MKYTIYHIITIFSIITFLGCKDNTNQGVDKAQETVDQRIEISKEQFNKNNMSLGRLEEKPFPTTIKGYGQFHYWWLYKDHSITGG